MFQFKKTEVSFMDDEYRALDDLARISFANIVWTHKIQEKQADTYEHQYKVLTTLNIIAASLTSAGILSITAFDHIWIKLLSTFISFIATAITAYLTSFDYKNMAQSTKTIAVKLVTLRDEMLVLLAKIKFKQLPTEELAKEFYAIQERVHMVYSEAPNTTNQAVRKADTAINERKDGIYTDEEIDRLLPQSLRRITDQKI